MAESPRFQPSASLDVVGIGNAIVDVLVQTQDSFLEQHGLSKGGMALIDEQQAETLYQSSGPGLETSGGSVANTMVGIAQLGGRTGFIGRVRDDQLGSIFTPSTFSTPIIAATTSTISTWITFATTSPSSSSRCIANPSGL